MERVAITGIGIVSCLGTGARKVARSLREGRSGVGLDPARQALGFRSALTGTIDDFTPPPLDKKRKRTLSEYGMHAYGAALEAIAMAGWDGRLLQSERTGLIVGNDSSALATVEQVQITRREKSTFPIGASTVFQALTSSVTMNLSTILGCQGASWTLSGACASGGDGARSNCRGARLIESTGSVFNAQDKSAVSESILPFRSFLMRCSLTARTTAGWETPRCRAYSMTPILGIRPRPRGSRARRDC